MLSRYQATGWPTCRLLLLLCLAASLHPMTIIYTVVNQGLCCRGGAWNHAFFFKHLAPPGTEQAMFDTAASDDLQDAINTTFGSFDGFKAQLTTAASGVFGSGWAWLIATDDGLAITTTPNQNNPLQIATGCGHQHHSWYSCAGH